MTRGNTQSPSPAPAPPSPPTPAHAAAAWPSAHYPLPTPHTRHIPPNPLRRSLPPSHPQSFPASPSRLILSLTFRGLAAAYPISPSFPVLPSSPRPSRPITRDSFPGSLPHPWMSSSHTGHVVPSHAIPPSGTLAGRHMPTPTARSVPVLAKRPNGVVL